MERSWARVSTHEAALVAIRRRSSRCVPPARCESKGWGGSAQAAFRNPCQNLHGLGRGRVWNQPATQQTPQTPSPRRRRRRSSSAPAPPRTGRMRTRRCGVASFSAIRVSEKYCRTSASRAQLSSRSCVCGCGGLSVGAGGFWLGALTPWRTASLPSSKRRRSSSSAADLCGRLPASPAETDAARAPRAWRSRFDPRRWAIPAGAAPPPTRQQPWV